MIQWLRLGVLTARGQGLIPGWGTKTLKAKKKKKKKKKDDVSANTEARSVRSSGFYMKGFGRAKVMRWEGGAGRKLTFMAS